MTCVTISDFMTYLETTTQMCTYTKFSVTRLLLRVKCHCRKCGPRTFNTCAVTKQAEKQARQAIRKLRKNDPF